MDFRGVTLEQYDRATEWMGLLPGGPSPKGELFHWAMKTDDGLRIFDVWESREAFEQFLAERVRPVAPQVGVFEPPEIQYFEVHNYFARGRWRS